LKECGDGEKFSELCFCILTANSSARLGMKIQQVLGEDFLRLPEGDLAERLKRLGHRYYNKRAEFIIKARRFKNIGAILSRFSSSAEARAWLARNVQGLGFKEASHFLRNLGYLDLAILDRHIRRLMEQYGLTEGTPKTLTAKTYLELEKRLKKVAERVGMPVGQLDLYLWYVKTGEVLK
jgi:N-glycosylase/DNA lyase